LGLRCENRGLFFGVTELRLSRTVIALTLMGV
jgi:hypothetical protein